MDSVPEEIIIAVLDQLDRKADLNTILNLRMINKKWRRIATPYVYITIQNSKPKNQVPLWDFTLSTDLLCCLSWKLTRRPDLAGFVKEVVSRPWRDTRWRPSVEMEEMCGTYLSALARAAPAMPEHLREDIVLEMLDNVGDALLAFVLTLCTEIEQVIIPVLDRGCGPRTRQVIRFALEQLDRPLEKRCGSILASVRHLQLGDYMNGLSLADALDMVCLPKLQHLELGNLGDTTASTNATAASPPPPLASSRPRIRPSSWGRLDLTLDSCRLSEAGLSTFLEACNGARSLFIKMRTGNAQYPSSSPSHAPLFASALERHGKGLRFLVVDTSAFEAGPPRSPSPSSPNDGDGDGDSAGGSSSSSATDHPAHLLRALAALDGSLECLALTRRDLPSPPGRRLAASLPRSLREFMVLDAGASRAADEVAADAAAFRALVRGPRTPGLGRVVAHYPPSFGFHSDLGLAEYPARWAARFPSTRVLQLSSCVVWE